MFVPGATLAQVAAVLQDYDHHKDIYAPDVRQSKLLEREVDEARIYYQLYRNVTVTVVINANFDAHFANDGPTRGLSRSYSTRMAEVENADTPKQRELPVGNDHGYLWRLDTYWNIEEKDGGAYIQLESIALTRNIPLIFAWLVNPLTKSLPRAVISNLLAANAQSRHQPRTSHEPLITRYCEETRSGSILEHAMAPPQPVGRPTLSPSFGEGWDQKAFPPAPALPRLLVAVVLMVWSLAALLLVAARWIDPPTTAVHIERRVQSWIHGTPYQERYKFVPRSQISPDLQHAVIAAEDARFYQHHGLIGTRFRLPRKRIWKESARAELPRSRSNS